MKSESDVRGGFETERPCKLIAKRVFVSSKEQKHRRVVDCYSAYCPFPFTPHANYPRGCCYPCRPMPLKGYQIQYISAQYLQHTAYYNHKLWIVTNSSEYGVRCGVQVKAAIKIATERCGCDRAGRLEPIEATIFGMSNTRYLNIKSRLALTTLFVMAMSMATYYLLLL